MVGVVQRLTSRYGTVNAIVKELEAVGLATKAGTFLLLLRVYWYGGIYPMVLQTFHEMGCFGFTPNSFAYNVIMDVSFRSGDKDGGMKVLKEVPSPNYLSYNIALRHVCRSNDSVLIRDVLCRMLRNGYYPTSEALEMVLNCFCRVGNLDAAFQALGLMTTLGISLSVTIWTMLIDGSRSSGEPGMAGFLFSKMVETGMESGMVDKAFSRILNESEGNARDLVFCNALMHSLIKMGRDGDARSLFDSMLRSRMTPDSFSICSLLPARCNSKFSVLWLKWLSRFFIQADLVLYNSLMHYCCDAGYPLLAEWFYCDMVAKEFRPDNYSFAGYLRALFAQGRSDEAVCVYNGLLVTGHDLDAHVHTLIIQCLVESGKLYKAVDCFRKAVVKNYPLDAVSYTVVIRALLESGRQEAALDWYYQMKDVNNNVSPTVHTYRAMLHGLCRRREPERVQKLMEDIVEAGVRLDYYSLVKLTELFPEDVVSTKFENGLNRLWSTVILPDNAICSTLLDEQPFDDAKVSTSEDDVSDVAASVG
ncbi:Putative pentatricopeptide repeat-containing protein At1g16830 [Linum grandiflorum]